MPRSREVERVRGKTILGEILERPDDAVARPLPPVRDLSVERSWDARPVEIHNHYAAPETAPVREPRQRLAPWWLALMAVAAAVALLVWALNGPPVLQPIDHKHPNQHQGR